MYFFNYYSAAPWPTLGHFRGDSLTNQVLITAFHSWFAPKVTGRYPQKTRRYPKKIRRYPQKIRKIVQATHLKITVKKLNKSQHIWLKNVKKQICYHLKDRITPLQMIYNTERQLSHSLYINFFPLLHRLLDHIWLFWVLFTVGLIVFICILPKVKLSN